MMPSQQGYDRAITVFSPDGRLYQVEYAIETVKRGALAIGIKTKQGVVIAVEEKPRRLQISTTPQKIFQVDYHIGAAAAGYIPDARAQVDNARFFSQSNKLVYDEPVEVQTVAKHLADQCQQYTQYAGARPLGVSLIIGGVDNAGSSLYLTDPSGAYVLYDAVAIGANSDVATEFLEKNYSSDLTLDDAKALAIAVINLVSEVKEGSEHIKISQINSETKLFEFIQESEITKLIDMSKTKYPTTEK
ncbi:archaeal proteasome endopeptidase complex subunit alpha [Candidatus Nitrosopelagicus sp.]|nr:archaeal proteasome endopeptidase complex subunit alpha [Candidatus Nitrosopelagicus sp.]